MQILEGDSLDYRTANELLQIMSKNLEYNGNQALSAADLVTLYENMELGTKVQERIKYQGQKRTPNQYVETIVYNDDPDSEGSDISEIYTKEDFRDICMINNERIDFINSIQSYDNSLSHKLGHLRLRSSDLSAEYERYSIFNDPFLKDQLRTLDVFNSVLPPSLLDYICCRRLDDDYIYYIDNIITYVQYTIEQLKRISNGDYLTDVAKEKWRKANERKDAQTTLTNSVSIPLCMNGTDDSHVSTWNGTVHSEMDLRFLKKILEKRLIFEIPKLLSGSYTLFGKCCNDKLIIRCKKDKNNEIDNKQNISQIKLALELKYPKSINDTNRDHSILALPPVTVNEIVPHHHNFLAIEYKKTSDIKIIEISEEEIKGNVDNQDYIVSESELTDKAVENYLCDEGTNSVSVLHDLDNTSSKKIETDSDDVFAADALACAIQKFNASPAVVEEIENVSTHKPKKTSPTRIRIKSPYENKSYVIEERKRKRLMEIRDKREKKKMAMSKKIGKNKYGQGATMPRSSNSVTKLSITNKSFYNSIYGQSSYGDEDVFKRIHGRKSDSLKNSESGSQGYSKNLLSNTSDLSGRSSYCLDATETEVEHTIEQIETSRFEETGVDEQNFLYKSSFINFEEKPYQETFSPLSTGIKNTVPTNSPTAKEEKSALSMECRQSIEKLYDIMKPIVKNQDVENGSAKLTFTSHGNLDKTVNTKLTTTQSNSSLKNELTSSDQSNCSFEKPNDDQNQTSNLNKYNNKLETSSNIPIVVVTNKYHTVKFDEQSIKRSQKRVHPVKVTENPLKAISQLLHRFENVQKANNKTGNDKNVSKKTDIRKEDKNNSRDIIVSNPTNLQHYSKYNESKNKRISTPKEKSRYTAREILNSPSHCPNENKMIEKVNKNKITDIIDEVKEMRGEAVRGPKQTRLDALAKPKKLYVDAYNEEYRRRAYNDRFKRASQIPQRTCATTVSNSKQKVSSNIHVRSKVNTTLLPLEGAVKIKRTPHNSPERRRSPEQKRVTSPREYKIDSELKTSKKEKLEPKSLVTGNFGETQSPNRIKCNKVRRSCIPIVPTNLVVASSSAKEASSLGNELHCMIDAMINIQPSLNTLTECSESLSEINNENGLPLQSLIKSGGILSTSDFPVDIFEDKNIVTAVASISYAQSKEDDSNLDNKRRNITKSNERTSSSLTQLEKLENALHLTGSTFHKKLRIKNLTPNQSMQQIFLLQSGDGSLVVKSSLQKIQASKTNAISERHSVRDLSNMNHADWKYKPMPMHCFPVRCSLRYSTSPHFVFQSVNKVKSEILYKNVEMIANSADEIASQNNTHPFIDCNASENKKDKSDRTCQTPTNLPKHLEVSNVKKSEENETVILPKKESEHIANTTSLDVLVGLFNEIRKISTYQSNIQIETLDNHINTKNPDEVSITSLDKLRKLESNPSIFSYYISNDEVSVDQDNLCDENDQQVVNYEPLYIDKEVSAKESEKEYIHRFTEVPSQLSHEPTKSTNSANISNLQSHCKTEYKTVYVNTSFYNVNALNKKKKSNMSTGENDLKKLDKQKSRSLFFNNVLCIPIKDKHFDNEVGIKDVDSLFKVKRDILVIVYSVLVLTVFAAFYFPVIFYI